MENCSAQSSTLGSLKERVGENKEGPRIRFAAHPEYRQSVASLVLEPSGRCRLFVAARRGWSEPL